MNLGTDRPTETNVTFAPRLTEESLPVTLPKDADKPLENAGQQIQPSPPPEDKRVSAGALDLQLVPQVYSVDLLALDCPAWTHVFAVLVAVTGAAD